MIIAHPNTGFYAAFIESLEAIMSRLGVCMLFTAAAFALCSCGGGGGGGTALRPQPAPPPPSSPASAAVTIFSEPAVGEYASVGASVSGPGGSLDTYSNPDVRFGEVSTKAEDQPLIRYTGEGYYEVRLPGSNWDRLVHYKGLGDPTSSNNYFQPGSVAQNQAHLIVRRARDKGYVYSELAGWASGLSSRFGYVAFGVPTPPGGVPVTGSASYMGMVSGSTDILVADNLYGGFYPLPVDGTVTLNFDFANATLDGSMTLTLSDGMNPVELGTWAFKDTVFSSGSASYSGRFDTSVAGQNFFLGRFTGPNAQETIGAWAIPFLSSKDGGTFKADGQTHQAFGAWIAKPSI